MCRSAPRSGAVAVALIGASALGVAADVGPGRQTSPATGPILSQASPDTARSVPDILIRGQLILTPQQRQQIRQSIEQTNVEEQPIPRAFAPAVGMTAPPELRLTPLPKDLEQFSGITKQHQFARLERGTILIVGQDRLVVAMIAPGEGRVGAAPPPQPGR